MRFRLLTCATLLVLAGCTTDPPVIGEVYEFVGPSGGQFLRGEVVEIGDCRAIAEAEQNDGDLTGVMAQFGERPDAPCAGLLMEEMRPFAGPNGQAVGQMMWVLPLEQLQNGTWERTEAGAPPLETRQPTSSISMWLLVIVILVTAWPVLLKAMQRRARDRPSPLDLSGAPYAGAADRPSSHPHQAEFDAEQRRWEQWRAERDRGSSGTSSQARTNTGSPKSAWNAVSAEVAAAFYLLDLKPDATDDQIRQARRKKVARWHPDRFEHDDQLKAKATEKLKRINQAYELLMRDREGR